MRHFVIAAVIGLLTIGISVFVLSDSDESYEGDAKVAQSISLGETFEGENYNIKPTSFNCGEYAATDGTTAHQGCVLSVDLTNTSIFEQVLVLDGDKAISLDGTEFESSDNLSKHFVENNGLINDIDIGETVQGGIFFDVPVGSDIRTVEIYESINADPIIITL